MEIAPTRDATSESAHMYLTNNVKHFIFRPTKSISYILYSMLAGGNGDLGIDTQQS